MYYLFPFHLIKKASNIVIYGAGNAGKNFVKQIEITNYCNVVGIVDMNYKTAQIKNYETHDITWLTCADYDCVFISVVNEKIQAEIKESLISMGIPEEKIVSYVSPAFDWDNPTRGYINQKEEYDLNRKLSGYLEQIDPSLLLCSDRIDVVARYLLFRDFMNDIENEKHLSLFSRFVFARTGGIEADSYFSGKGKNSVQEYISKGRELCKNIKENGFDAQYYIPLGNDRKPYDGLHRMAAAIAAGEKIYVHDYADRDALDCDMKWFKEQGFSLEDRLEILRGFCDVYHGKCGMLVLYAPCKELWEYIEGQVKQRFKIVDVFDLDYSSNFIAFENTLRQIYWDNNQYNEWLTRKLDMLMLAPLMFRIIVISDEAGNNNFYEEIHNLKKQIRVALSMDIDERIPIQLHSSDSEEEFNHLKKILISQNQYKSELSKINSYYRTWFLEKLEELKKWCNNNGVNIDDVCVVGSYVMELYGLREANDLNFIIKQNIKCNCETCACDLMMKHNYCIDEKGNVIADDIIIDDSSYHTVFADIKFCNLEFVYRYKQKRNSLKDINDVKRISDRMNLLIGMEDKKFLERQIKIEMHKRGYC